MPVSMPQLQSVSGGAPGKGAWQAIARVREQACKAYPCPESPGLRRLLGRPSWPYKQFCGQLIKQKRIDTRLMAKSLITTFALVLASAEAARLRIDNAAEAEQGLAAEIPADGVFDESVFSLDTLADEQFADDQSAENVLSAEGGSECGGYCGGCY